MQAENVRRVLVCGSGIMGHGIAHVAALAGYQVVLTDLTMELLEKARDNIRRNMQKGLDLGKLGAAEMAAALERISLSTDNEQAAGGADLVIEAVSENLELKKQLFRRWDAVCPAHTVLATNTSAQSVTEIAAATSRPDRVIGMHFFNPAHIMRLVEVVKGLETDPAACELVAAVARRMGKETVLVNDFAGFATSRISAMIGNEAFYMLMEGVAGAQEIDRAVKLGLNHPMGPLELADIVGLDTRLKVLEHLHESFGERFRPCPLLVKYVRAGRLGRKSGRGVYDYTGKA